MSNYDDAIVLKLSKKDKEFIQQIAKRERLIVSALTRNKICRELNTK